MALQIKKLSDLSLAWQLLLVPVDCHFGLRRLPGLFIHRFVEWGKRSRELRDIDYPILDEAEKNLNAYGRVVDALEAAVATGESDFLDIAIAKAGEITKRYVLLEKLDTENEEEIVKLKNEFDTYFAVALGIAKRMAAQTDMPTSQELMKMKSLRDAYFSGTKIYKANTEREYHKDVIGAIEKSQRAQKWGAAIGTLMLLAIAALTLLVTRGILALEKHVADRNKMLLVSVNNELEREIQKLKEAEEAKSSRRKKPATSRISSSQI